MPAAIRPYSMAVAPDSSAKNWRTFAIMVGSIAPSSKASVKWILEKQLFHGNRRVSGRQRLKKEPRPRLVMWLWAGGRG
jgi:hypothetical protein